MEKKRLKEIIFTFICLLLCFGLLVSAKNLGAELEWASLPEKVAFALVVALAVRWLTILFEEIPETKDIYRTAGDEIRAAIRNANDRIWIFQTWLPGVGGDATTILDNSKVAEPRVIFASFAGESPIYPRIKTRLDLIPEGGSSSDIINAAKTNVAGSAGPFKNKGKKDCVKFSKYHHPGWIAIIDDEVFWGATPMGKDNWSVPEVAYRAPATEWRARHWIKEFNIIWAGKDPLTGTPLSHSYDEEKQYNSLL